MTAGQARMGSDTISESARRSASGKQGWPMSTITRAAPVSQPSSPANVLTEGGDQRTVFRGVDRHTYDQLSEAAGEGRPLRLVYDGKDLEFVVTGNTQSYSRPTALMLRSRRVGSCRSAEESSSDG